MENPSPIRQSELSRRDWIKLLGAAGAATALWPADASSAGDTPDTARSGGPSGQGAGYYRFAVGSTEVSIVSDGALGFNPPFPTLAVNASTEAVRRALAREFIDYERVFVQVNAVLIKSPKDTLLVDTGCGKLFGPATGGLIGNLANAGVQPGDVSAIVLTHLHGDHLGGLLDDTGKSQFPNAEVFLHKDEHAFWSAESPDLSGTALPDEQRAALIAGARRVLEAVKFTLVDGEREVRPAVTVVPAPGHTPGHLALLVDGGKREQFLYITDAVHHHALQMRNPGYYVAFDMDPPQAVGTRKKLLTRAAADRMLVAGAHLPFPAVGHVRQEGEAFEWVPTVWQW